MQICGSLMTLYSPMRQRGEGRGFPLTLGRLLFKLATLQTDRRRAWMNSVYSSILLYLSKKNCDESTNFLTVVSILTIRPPLTANSLWPSFCKNELSDSKVCNRTNICKECMLFHFPESLKSQQTRKLKSETASFLSWIRRFACLIGVWQPARTCSNTRRLQQSAVGA